jgi:hypothetical protein
MKNIPTGHRHHKGLTFSPLALLFLATGKDETWNFVHLLAETVPQQPLSDTFSNQC